MSDRPSVLVLLALLACSPGQTADRQAPDSSAVLVNAVPPVEVLARARGVADGLGKDLQSHLFAALDSGGPAHAITFCADSAQALSARHAAEGVYIRRVSLRVRNPSNRPDSAEARDLRRLDSLKAAGALPAEEARMGRLENGQAAVEYIRPILVQERCLACHGARDQIAAPVRRILAERYPDDQATGYQAGDLRGMISVRLRP